MIQFFSIYIFSVIPGMIVFSKERKKLGILFILILQGIILSSYITKPYELAYLIFCCAIAIWTLEMIYALMLINKRKIQTIANNASDMSVAPIEPFNPQIYIPRKPLSKSVMLSVAAVIIIIGIISSVVIHNQQLRKMAFLCMVAGVAVVFFIDYHLEKKRKKEQEISEAIRAKELTQTIITDRVVSQKSMTQVESREITVLGSSGILYGLGGVLFSLLPCYAILRHHDSVPILIYFCTGFFFFFGLLLIIKVTPYLGNKPLLRLTRQGFYNPAYGFIPWNEVLGIHIREATYQGMVLFHILSFNISKLVKYTGQFHPVSRFLFKFRRKASKNLILILLNKTNETPDTVYMVARQLWREETGKDSVWYPGMSPEVSMAWDRIEEWKKNENIPSLDEMKKVFRSNPKDFERLAKENMLSMQDKANEFKKYFEIVRADARKQSRVPRIVLIIVTLVFIASILIPILMKRFM